MLEPIPLPRRVLWREFRFRLIPAFAFATAFIIVALLWRKHICAPIETRPKDIENHGISQTRNGTTITSKIEPLTHSEAFGKRHARY